jgi:hypothetical protein
MTVRSNENGSRPCFRAYFLVGAVGTVSNSKAGKLPIPD